jgi:hypothetical protein
MTDVLLRRDMERRLPHEDTETHRKKAMEAESRVNKGCQCLPESARSWGRNLDHTLPQGLQKENPYTHQHLDSDLSPPENTILKYISAVRNSPDLLWL